MKKVINGKLYDTDTARELGLDGGGDSFGRWRETLFQKRTGEYFLFGEGGPATKYACEVGQNQWSGGSKIMPMTFDNARQWAEEHLSTEEYEELFGVSDAETNEKNTLCIQLPADLVAKLRASAAEQGSTLSGTIEKALRAML